jgi:hypothetical protein
MYASRYLLLGAALLTILVMPTSSSAQVFYTPVKGKIFNNLMDDGRTLGVVALNLDGEKIKCAIVGDPLPPEANFSIKFVHTVVCEDHSQVSFLTQGNVTGVLQVCPSGFVAFSFLEVSTPDLTRPSKGLFKEITGGSLTITGTVNCQLEVDMTFQGYAYLP